MYGPLTSKRWNMAFELRKELKAKGDIISGYVQFPAKLMVNYPGNINRFGKKVYQEHSNFSSLLPFFSTSWKYSVLIVVVFTLTKLSLG